MHKMHQCTLEKFCGRRSRETFNAQHLETALIQYEYPSIIKEEISIDDCNEGTIITEIPIKSSQEDIAERFDFMSADKSTLFSQKCHHKDVKKVHVSNEWDFKSEKKSISYKAKT